MKPFSPNGRSSRTLRASGAPASDSQVAKGRSILRDFAGFGLMRLRSGVAFIGLAAGLVLTACAAANPQPPGPTLSLAPGAERGRHVAERSCAGCHALDATGQSPSAMAPPFRVLRMRYNPVRLERHIAELTARGYFAMPAQPISQADAEDVAAYIETLR